MSGVARPPAAGPRLGFLGVGWIGRHRLGALAASGAQVVAVTDPSAEALTAVRQAHPETMAAPDYGALLDADLDGVVIATPSAAHAEQSIRALERGLAVFCQKPVGRDAHEARAVVDAARRADRLLHADMSYRYTAAMRAVRDLVRAGALGTVYAADLVFHNAYGPDKPWFYDRALSGGGCVMDLGIHLVDLALWVLGGRVRAASAALFAGGRRLAPGDDAVEDVAEAQLELEDGRCVRLACSWNLHAGRDAVIEARFHGTDGGAGMVNENGSFYDFRAERYHGTAVEVLARPPDEWGGRAAVCWAERLARDPSFDPAAEELVEVAAVLDRIYGR